MLRLGRAQRDLERQYDFFVISSDEPLTAVIDSPVPEGWNRVPRLILLTTAPEEPDPQVITAPVESDSPVLRQLITLLLSRPRPNDRAPADNIVVLDEYTVQVNGSWLLTGLLKHWIRELFRQDDIDVVDSSDVREPVLASA